MEKRKFLLPGQRLAKFMGVGAAGERNYRLAHRLAEAGFAPQPEGFHHGFVVSPWLAPVGNGQKPPHDLVLRYLAFRRTLPADRTGTSLEELFAMAAYNLGLRHGEAIADAVRSRLGDAARWQAEPCCTDNRMHRWEWVHASTGWQKLDGTEHSAAHDLIGCQDIAWDLAGAAVELDWTERELSTAAESLGSRSEPGFVEAHLLCYLGFQTGLWTMAKDRNGEGEAAAIERQLARYDERLRALLN